jgi:hypothetical protein
MLGGALAFAACSSSKPEGGGGTDATATANDAATDLDQVGTDAVAVDGAACTGGPGLGPVSTMGSPRPGFGWTFAGPNASDAGTASDAGVADGAAPDGSAPARCQSVPAPYQPGISCRGGARLESRTTGPSIAFDDGSELVWNGELRPAAQPYAQQATGDPVWVDYEQRWTVVCPVCGAYSTQTLEIRDAEGGRVRFFVQHGPVLPNLMDAQVIGIFGATASAVPACTFHTVGGTCTTFDRTQYDHVLATTPAQTILDADWTEVDSPNGRYEVFWASSTEANFQPIPNCYDGPATATDTGFVATRLAP